MKCPNCRLINPEDALRCDCGYDFATQTVKKSFLAEAVVKGIEAVPQAESKPERDPAIKWVVGFLVALAILWPAYSIYRFNNPRPASTESESPRAPKTRKEQIESYFSAWDSSHIGLTRLIKKSMNDPKSYEHVETRYIDKQDHLIVITEFRGKNAFGGVVKNTVTAKVDLDGNVIEILSQGP